MAKKFTMRARVVLCLCEFGDLEFLSCFVFFSTLRLFTYFLSARLSGYLCVSIFFILNQVA